MLFTVHISVWSVLTGPHTDKIAIVLALVGVSQVEVHVSLLGHVLDWQLDSHSSQELLQLSFVGGLRVDSLGSLLGRAVSLNENSLILFVIFLDLITLALGGNLTSGGSLFGRGGTGATCRILGRL
jgi:hypothetical protein